MAGMAADRFEEEAGTEGWSTRRITTNRRCRARGKGRGGSVLSVRLDAEVRGICTPRGWKRRDKDLFEYEERIDEKELSNLGCSKKNSKSIRCNNKPS